jgi:lysine 2,3-aminomutase
MKEIYTPELFFSISDGWISILKSGDDIDEVRTNLLNHVNERHFKSYSDADTERSGLDLIIIRDCARAWRGVLHVRSEKLAGFSVLSELVKAARGRPDPSLSEAFWADICHLVRGIEGKFKLHESNLFSFTGTGGLKGRDAALERSGELDLIHKYVAEKISRFSSGLDRKLVRERDANKERILSFTGTDSKKWDDWHWQLKNIARDERRMSGYARLCHKEIENIKKVKSSGIPFGVTPYYASLFDYQGGIEDRAIRAQVLFPESYISAYQSGNNEDYIKDFMLENDTSPVCLVTRRYPEIVILKPYNSCPQICVYCQRNWEIKSPLEKGAMAGESRLNDAIRWIEEHEAITEVLVTGGDPLVMSDLRLGKILKALTLIGHIRRIRIGTRIPVTLPMRFTDKLCDTLASFRIPGKREIAIVTHIQNPLEVTPEFVKAVEKIRLRGISVYNQLVFTFYISRRFEAARLRSLIRLCGVDPYYSFYPKGKLETADYRVPIARMLQEQKEESRLMPGLSRTDEPVYNVPGLGKNHLNAWQHRDLISIRKDGSRVYEFHPWEKKIADQKTYVGDDVPILDYLKRLEEIGEQASEYESIWYYF